MGSLSWCGYFEYLIRYLYLKVISKNVVLTSIFSLYKLIDSIFVNEQFTS